MRTLVDGSGLTVTVAKYLTPNGTDINKSGIIPDIEVKMNINPILQGEIGTRKDKQYRAGEKELVNIIKRNNQISEFNPNTTNLYAFLKVNKENKVFSLN
jgi:carboxyl-terminal processing protease